MSVDVCPYCKVLYCISSNIAAHRDVENYGSKVFHLPCTFCNKVLEVYYVREVRLRYIKKSDKKLSESDY